MPLALHQVQSIHWRLVEFLSGVYASGAKVDGWPTLEGFCGVVKVFTAPLHYIGSIRNEKYTEAVASDLVTVPKARQFGI
jgi:hypothetical protein